MRRTHICGELKAKQIQETVILQGWVKRIRKMGAKNFVDLKDFSGIVQLIINDELIKEIKPEFVIEIQGIVQKRLEANSKITTGEIEVVVEHLKIINKSKLTPFVIEDNINISEETRLKYRYLDLRRPKMQDNLKKRALLNSTIRKFLEENNFLEVETPTLIKSTPEGSRDFLVPSRLNSQKFYALPQSPQLIKQLLMISTIDRYYQIARCYRDEDFRLDRQPEFSQLDLEMNFATGEDVIFLVEQLMKKIMKKIKNIDLKLPLKRISYADAIRHYGSDKPDLRFNLLIKDLNQVFENTEVKLLKNLDKNIAIRGLMIEQLLNKTQIKEIEETAKQNHLTGIAFIKYSDKNWTGSIASQLSDQEKENLLKTFDLKEKGTIVFFKGIYEIISKALGSIRNKLGQMFNLADPNQYKFLWVVNFPLFEWSDEEQKFVACHHPFTSPTNESLKDFDQKPEKALANAYDIVLNGSEIGGGSQRISDQEVQKRIFQVLNLNENEVQNNFGWFLEAYSYGAPYHAGLALGLDRLIMILTQEKSIRNVIAFPKNASGVDTMMNAPDFIDETQLKELKLKTFK